MYFKYHIFYPARIVSLLADFSPSILSKSPNYEMFLKIQRFDNDLTTIFINQKQGGLRSQVNFSTLGANPLLCFCFDTDL